MASRIWGLIPAAGTGSRMGESRPKQYLELSGKSILEHSLDTLLDCDLISGTAVGIARDDPYWQALAIDHPRFLGVFQGGRERTDTVANGLGFLADKAGDSDWVIVHDAVRPCLHSNRLDLLIHTGTASKCGAILAVPAVDTVKQVGADGCIRKTLDRNNLMLATTPQLFPVALLRRALAAAAGQGSVVTDESSAVESLGLAPRVIIDRRDNIKITHREDLDCARAILEQHRHG